VCVWCVECLCFNFVTAQEYKSLEEKSNVMQEDSKRMTEVGGCVGCVGVWVCCVHIIWRFAQEAEAMEMKILALEKQIVELEAGAENAEVR